MGIDRVMKRVSGPVANNGNMYLAEVSRMEGIIAELQQEKSGYQEEKQKFKKIVSKPDAHDVDTLSLAHMSISVAETKIKGVELKISAQKTKLATVKQRLDSWVISFDSIIRTIVDVGTELEYYVALNNFLEGMLDGTTPKNATKPKMGNITRRANNTIDQMIRDNA